MYFSKTSTLAPAELSFPATANPPIPLPTTTASYSWSVLIARKDTLQDARRALGVLAVRTVSGLDNEPCCPTAACDKAIKIRMAALVGMF